MSSSDYRVVEIAPSDGKRHTRQKSRVELYRGSQKDEVLRVLGDYWASEYPGRRPWSETRIYLGNRRIYQYEL